MIAVFGGGAFGTALAMALCAGRKQRVMLYARDDAQARHMQAARCNHRYLPGLPFPDDLEITSDPTQAADAQICLLAVPTQKLRGFLSAQGALLAGRTLVACCKGIEAGSGLGPVEVMRDCVPSARHALLSGPAFAHDIAAGLPTAMTLACAASPTAGTQVQAALSAPALRLYLSDDTTGVALGGALKNVMAIACGAVIGAGLGVSARAALMTRGFAEMQRLALASGAREATLQGLSGLGDLTLTCTSDLSRNFRFGLALGRGEAFDPSVTVEGAATAAAAVSKAQALGVEMPVAQAVVSLQEGRFTIDQVVESLLSRPLVREAEPGTTTRE